MSQTNLTHPTSSDSEDIPNYDDEGEEDSLSDASTVCTAKESSNQNKMDIEALIKTSQRRMEKLDLFVALFVRVASRIRTMSKEEMEANRRLNSKNDT